MSELEPCRECGCLDQTWFWSNAILGGIQQGRLNTSEVIPVFYLGCDICGETLSKLSADDVAVKLNTRHIPEGFALVPIEPTAGMVLAANWSVYPEVCEVDMTKAYKRMITACQEGK